MLGFVSCVFVGTWHTKPDGLSYIWLPSRQVHFHRWIPDIFVYLHFLKNLVLYFLVKIYFFFDVLEYSDNICLIGIGIPFIFQESLWEHFLARDFIAISQLFEFKSANWFDEVINSEEIFFCQIVFGIDFECTVLLEEFCEVLIKPIIKILFLNLLVIVIVDNLSWNRPSLSIFAGINDDWLLLASLYLLSFGTPVYHVAKSDGRHTNCYLGPVLLYLIH